MGLFLKFRWLGCIAQRIDSAFKYGASSPGYTRTGASRASKVRRASVYNNVDRTLK